MEKDSEAWLPGVHAAPNIQNDPDSYEIENEATDPDGYIETTMLKIASWCNRIVLDLGAGTGFHIPLFHQTARHVIAVEPHDLSRFRAMVRVAHMGLKHVSIMTGSAERLLLADASVDIVHARFAYFWGPGCERGLREVERVIRPGGTALIIDGDGQRGTFASWLARSSYYPDRDMEALDRFWRKHSFERKRIMSELRFKSQSDFEAAIRNNFSLELAEQILTEHQPLTVDCGFCIYHRTY